MNDLNNSLNMADLIVEYLEKMGIQHIFGVPGGGIEPLYNAMARSERNGGLRPIISRHESGGAFMADGYARESGKLGVVCSTTGPGSTNLITGVASAFVEEIPLLVITAQTALNKFGVSALQDSSDTGINIVEMMKNCTKYSTLVDSAEQLEQKLITAIMKSQEYPKGPVHLSIARDVLTTVQKTNKRILDNPLKLFEKSNSVDEIKIKDLYNLVHQLKNMVVVLGNQCGSDVYNIIKFAEMTNSNIITTPTVKGCINANHPLYKGVIGYAGHKSAEDVLMDDTVDLVLLVGSNYGELDKINPDNNIELNNKIVHIDWSNRHFDKSIMVKMQISGNIVNTFAILNEQFIRMNGNLKNDYSINNDVILKNISFLKEEEMFSKNNLIKPQRLMMELSKKLPNITRVYSDAGNSWSWTTHYLNLKSIGNYHIGMGFGSMAWAIGACIGNAVASKEPSMCVTGDGSYLMSGHELTVAVAEKLPVVFVILNDSSLGMVKHGQRLGGAESIGHELPVINFAKMADAVGANSIIVDSIEKLQSLNFNKLFSMNVPTVIDVRIDGEEVPPMGVRMKSLTNQ